MTREKRKDDRKKREGKKQGEEGEKVAERTKGMEEGRHFIFLGRNNLRAFTISPGSVNLTEK